VKGFIRAYCQFLGTRPDEALTQYRALVGEPSPDSASHFGRSRSSRPLTPIGVSLVLLIVLGGGLLALNLGLRGGATGGGGQAPASRARAPEAVEPTPKPPPPAEPTVATPAPTPVESASTPAATPAASLAAPSVAAVPATPPHKLELRALEPTWVRVQTDRGTVEEELPKGAVREWSTETRFVLRVGNAGGLELTLDGKRLPPLGARGAVIPELILPQSSPGS
jgi:cytoskeletal protein RodZ